MTVTAVKTGGIGQPVLRKEDLRLLTGQGRYTDDVNLPGQAYSVVVRSPHAHARIRGIDTAKARKVPGVLAVLTGADMQADHIAPIPCYATIPGLVDVPLNNTDGSPKKESPLPLLATDKVRLVGDAVAAVIGDTLAAAQEGAEAVEVDYQPLPAVTETTATLKPGAPIVWEDVAPTNLCVDAHMGDAAATDAAFKRAEHVASLRTQVNRVTGAPLEPRSVVCQYDGRDGRFTVYCGGDNSVRQKRDLAKVMNIEPDRVRFIARDVGGNFGTRNWFYPEYGIAAWAAKKLGRPVKWTQTRSEAFLADYQGRDLYAEAELALDKAGNFLGLRADLISNVGAYTVIYVPLMKTSELLTSVYHLPAAFVRGRAVVSNTSPTAPYRSAGRPEAMFIMERLIDMAAKKFGFDRIELRRRNIVRDNAMPYRTPLGLTYDSGTFGRAMENVVKRADWDGFPARKAEARKRGKLRGIGISNFIEITSGFPLERTEISLQPDDQRVDVVIGTTASGQGHETSFAQCVSEWLGVPFESIRLITGDTDTVKEGGGSHSARSMRMAGIVMGTATKMIIEKATQIAAHVLEASPADVEFAKGVFTIKGTDRRVGIFEVAKAATTRNDLPRELQGTLGAEYQEMMKFPGFPYGCQVGEVEIDPDTGELTVVSVTMVDDVGRAVNPMILHGQAHGGIAQGFGQAMMEHAYYDPETGQMLAGSFMDYAIPRADTLPSFDTEIMEVPTPTNPLGVRAGGESGTTPALAVVANAVVDALADYDVTHFELPATPERIWRAMHGNGAGRRVCTERSVETS